MEETAFTRLEALIGADAVEKLRSSRVAVFGLGGVGSYVAEALARSAVGSLLLVDNDTVCVSNLNRQLIATTDTIGQKKADVAKKRVESINPEAKVEASELFFSPETSDKIDFSSLDYIVDAIDSVTGKLELVMKAYEYSVPIISCMGTGNKLDPTAFEVADIYETCVCPLARVMRRELRARGIKGLKVVYSREEPRKPLSGTGSGAKKSPPPASSAFVPSVAGLIMAGEVIKDLTSSARV